MATNQTSFLSKSFEEVLRKFLGKDVVIHNEFSANQIIRIFFSIGGMSIRDRICVCARDVEVNKWIYHENVLMGPLDNVEAQQDELNLTVAAITIVIRFVEKSSIEVMAYP